MKMQALKELFRKVFGSAGNPVHVYFAPGRVNLIGEHTDYNSGYVLPCALTFGTYLLIRKTAGKDVKLASENFTYRATVPWEEIGKKHGSEWVNYPIGVINQLMQKGLEPTGMEMLFYGNIPNGAGLSSSASVEVVTAEAINDLTGLGLGKVDIVKLSQKAENEFVGVNCGIMDQFAVGLGKADHAIFLDCGTLDYELVPLALGEYKIVIANTNKKRGLADSKYNERVEECASAVKFLKKKKQLESLSDISFDEFSKIKPVIPDETVRRRAAHVISENRRVLDAVEALKNDNLEEFGRLMNASHYSLRDDYEVTGRELDVLSELARAQEGVLGSRMTGAGFGGCTVSLVHSSNIRVFMETVGEGYYEQTGLRADFYVSEIGDGVHRIE
jgi:galactokinase